MRRMALALVLLMLLPAVSASLDITTDITYERKIANLDLGINGGALSPDSETVLLFGEDGFAIAISSNNAQNPDLDIELENETTNSLNAASWHPAGQSALIVGDGGTVLRYNSTTHGLSPAEGSSAISAQDLKAISFTPFSSVAYIGTDDGQIWKYKANEFTMIDDQGTSRITDVTCMISENICVISSLNDGIAVVDQSDQVTWISNTRFHTWVGISCEDPIMTYCTGFASGKKIAEIDINTLDTSESSLVNVTYLKQLDGDFIAETGALESSSIVAIGPLSMIRFTQYTQESFLMFSNENASAEDVFLGGDKFAFAWENSKNEGFLVTSYGRIVSFEPATEDDSGSIPAFLVILIALCVPGVFLGLIYWNSPWLQRKYAQLFGKKKKNKSKQ